MLWIRGDNIFQFKLIKIVIRVREKKLIVRDVWLIRVGEGDHGMESLSSLGHGYVFGIILRP